jgi:hypothetical protein
LGLKEDAEHCGRSNGSLGGNKTAFGFGEGHLKSIITRNEACQPKIIDVR